MDVLKNPHFFTPLPHNHSNPQTAICYTTLHLKRMRLQSNNPPNNWMYCVVYSVCLILVYLFLVCNTKDYAGNKSFTFACHPLDYCFSVLIQK